MPIIREVLIAIAGYGAVNVGYSFVLGRGEGLKGILNAIFASVFLPIWAIISSASVFPVFVGAALILLMCWFAVRYFNQKNWRYVIFLGLVLFEVLGAYATKSLVI